MKKIIKILSRKNGLEFLKQPDIKKEAVRINAVLKPFGLDREVRGPKDFYTLCILEEGLRNKQTIEALYEQKRTELLDIWDMLDYPKRNEFLHPVIAEAVAGMKKFYFHDKIILIPFFDEVINALYDHETAVLELPQFFKMYKQFSDKIVDPVVYGTLPYEAGFARTQVIGGNERGIALYEGRTHALIVLFQDGREVQLPLSLNCTGLKLDPPQGWKLAQAVLSEDPSGLIQALLQCGYVDEGLKKKLAKGQK